MILALADYDTPSGNKSIVVAIEIPNPTFAGGDVLDLFRRDALLDGSEDALPQFIVVGSASASDCTTRALNWSSFLFEPTELLELEMKTLNLITLVLTIVGGINWGLVGIAEFDLVAALFGAGSGLSRTVYTLVGLSALYQILPLLQAFKIDEPRAEAATRRI